MDFLLDAQGEDVVSGRQAVDGAEELALLAPELHDRIAGALPAASRPSSATRRSSSSPSRTASCSCSRPAPRSAPRGPRCGSRSTRYARASSTRRPGWSASPRSTSTAFGGCACVSEDEGQALCRALPASMGVASGPIALDVAAATRLAHEGRAPVLVRPDTTTEDIAGMALVGGRAHGYGRPHLARGGRGARPRQAVSGRLSRARGRPRRPAGEESADAPSPRETRSASMRSPDSSSPAVPGSRRNAPPPSWPPWRRGRSDSGRLTTRDALAAAREKLRACRAIHP